MRGCRTGVGGLGGWCFWEPHVNFLEFFFQWRAVRTGGVLLGVLHGFLWSRWPMVTPLSKRVTQRPDPGLELPRPVRPSLHAHSGGYRSNLFPFEVYEGNNPPPPTCARCCQLVNCMGLESQPPFFGRCSNFTNSFGFWAMGPPLFMYEVCSSSLHGSSASPPLQYVARVMTPRYRFCEILHLVQGFICVVYISSRFSSIVSCGISFLALFF